MDIEKRSFEFRADEEEEGKIIGHAAIFNEWADLGWFHERIAPGAFTDAIKTDDVRALFNHDPNFILGRTRSGTLQLQEDDKGLAVSIEPPDTSFARDLMTLIKRGDVSQMSFAFKVIKEEWDDSDKDVSKRTIKKVQLFDVSPVTFPAYSETDVAVRSYEQFKQTESDSTPYRLNIRRRRSRLQ